MRRFFAATFVALIGTGWMLAPQETPRLVAPGPLLAEIKIGALSTVAAAFVAMAAARLLHVGRFA